MVSYTKKGSSSGSDSHYMFTDPWKTKDLLWDSYYGFITNHRHYWLYRSMNVSNPKILASLVSYAVFFYGEIRDFLVMVYPVDCKLSNAVLVPRLHSLFGGDVLKLSHGDIEFLRVFFGSFMIDSGMKNVIHLKDDRSPGDRLLNDRYSDISGGSIDGKD